MTKPNAATETLPDQALQTLSHVALVANQLAKQLTGRDRALAYQIKSSALSALVLDGVARPNGARPNATIGLDFFGSRLHCPVSSLTPEARAIVRRKTGSVPAVSPISDRLTSGELDSLASFLRDRVA